MQFFSNSPNNNNADTYLMNALLSIVVSTSKLLFIFSTIPDILYVILQSNWYELFC